jgi:hypothetical protein
MNKQVKPLLPTTKRIAHPFRWAININPPSSPVRGGPQGLGTAATHLLLRVGDVVRHHVSHLLVCTRLQEAQQREELFWTGSTSTQAVWGQYHTVRSR